MDYSDQIQMLISAFVFGLLFQATTAALLLYIHGHGLAVFKDRRRLVLVLFLTSTALWAQVDFINYAVPSTSPNACQVTIIASTFFDQAARITISGFLLWSVGHAKKTPAENSGLCALMGTRTVMGAIFVGYARPQFAPVCVARTDMLAASITVMVLDIIIVGVLVIRAFTLGLLDVIREIRSSTKQEQSKALLYCTAGLFSWTLTSSAMTVGVPSIPLLLRTGLPAMGLMILVSILTIYTGALILPRHEDSTTPEARSPFVAQPTHSLTSLSDDDGSPVVETGYTRTANLFVVNPSNTPHDSSVMAYLEDVKAEDDNYIGYRSTGIRAVQTEDVSSSTVRVSNRASSGVFQSLSAATIEAIGSAAFLAAPRKAPVPSSANVVDQTRALPTADFSSTEACQKRARFGWSKKSAEKGVHKIFISNPVMDSVESQSAQPFARMRTIDLATAAASERERREGANKRHLVAKRPAPPPPKASEAWRKSSSTRRKEIPKRISVPPASTMAETVSDESRLSVALNANSTSASLSPGREDVRRRSPRSVKTLEGDIEKACLLASRPTTIVVPRGDSQQTVMYVNDIVYDNPGMVKSIIKEVPTTLRKSKSERYRKPVNSTKSSPTQPDPIMHRPRPYRRDSEKDGVFFASEPSPRHKRSKSSPSTGTKKTISQPHSSVTSVPKLPQRPTTAAGLKKLLPNDTRSMTVDEKISLLFPAPPGVHHVHSRRSSVPSIPRIPSSILLGDSFTRMLTDQEAQERRASKRTTISFGSQIQNDDRTPIAETPIINEHGIYRFSANTYRTLAGSPRDSQVPELPADAQNIEQSDSKYAQSQTSNSRRHSTITTSSSEGGGSHDDSKSAWASIHSPIPAIDVITAQRTARETYIRLRKDARAKSNLVNPRILHAPSPETEDEQNAIGDGEGLMTVIFGMGDIAPPPANMRSFLLNPSPVMLNNEAFLPPGNKAWHKRIGDELPAFSQRRKHLRSRTMPPPTPLLLGSSKRQASIVVPKPLVNEEEDSPETALREIQAQLSRFDGTSRESLGSLVQQLPEDSQRPPKTVSTDRFGLLANLEKEMGQQETLWMRMQHSFDRDSNSVITTPQVAECTPQALPSPPSETSPRMTPRTVNRRPRIRSRCGELTSANLANSPDVSQAHIWQQRLAKAEMEFKENAPAMLYAGNVNFLSTSRAQLGSPTPPDSVGSDSDPETEMDYDTDENIDDSDFTRAAPSTETNLNPLWKPRLSAPSVRVGYLWSVPHDISMVRNTPSEPAAKWLRPVRRRDQHELQIESSKLWSKPTLHANRLSTDLWGSRMACPRPVITRPKAQRPRRKSKRITFLPDILENPSPLPHKRDTLGIFQFPWGEKSDSAVYDPVPVPNRASISSFVSNSTFEQNQTQPNFEPAEYSSSFFDDYEEDYEGESEVNSDDDFDESTLWEIATLLNSQDVPSRNSLFPCPRIIEDYNDEDDSESDLTESTRNPIQSRSAPAWPITVKFLPIMPLKPLPPLPTLQDSDDCEQTHTAAENKIQQLAAPVWQTYLPALDDAVRGEPCEAESKDPGSRSKADARLLWDKAIGTVSTLPVEKAVTLWTQQSNCTTERSSPTPRPDSSKANPQPQLWTVRETKTVQQVVGIFMAGVRREDYRTSYQVPAALTTIRKRRVDASPLAMLSTQKMWYSDKKSSIDCYWISASSVRALSPSPCSASSSGRSSPCSDEVSISAALINASSHSGAEIVKVDGTCHKVSALSAVALPAADKEELAAVNQASERSSSLRESRVLASRNLWESKVSVTDGLLSQKPWRSSKIIVPEAFQETKQTVGSVAAITQEDATATALTKTSNEHDSAVRHPKFSSSNMVAYAACVHPVATDSVTQPTASSVEAQKTIRLWTPSSSIISQSLSTTSLWGRPTPAKDNVNQTVQPMKNTPARKRSKNDPPLSLLAVSSTSFWRPAASTSSPPKHWLHDTALRTTCATPTTIDQSPLSVLFVNTLIKQSPSATEDSAFLIPARSSTLTALKHSNNRLESQGNGLWIPAEKKYQVREETSATQDVFVKRPASHKNSSRRVEFDKIESTELWRLKCGLRESPKDWLRSRTATKVDFRW